MMRHIKSINPVAAFMLLVVLNLAPLKASAQQPINSLSEDRNRGIELYQRGDANGAIEVLRKAVKLHKDDITAWHYLGLSLGKTGKRDDARMAHEKAAKIAEKMLDSSLERLVTLPKEQLIAGADSADQFLSATTKPSKQVIAEWHDRAAFLRLFAIESAPTLETYSAKEVDTAVHILHKAEPVYTEEARKNQVKGMVVLKVLLAADGRVRGTQVLHGSPDGLTRMATIAAQSVSFVPAMKNGRSVSVWVLLEYNFDIY